MDKVEVATVIARWLHYVAAAGPEMFDKTRMAEDTLEDEEDTQEEEERCCTPCSCAPRPCLTRAPDTAAAAEEEGGSVLGRRSLACGCVELCYEWRGRRVGRSQRTHCDGSVTIAEYRQTWGPWVTSKASVCTVASFR